MEIKVVRFSSGFGNVSDAFLLMPKDFWYTTDKPTEARIYTLTDGFEIVEGDGNMEFFAIDQDNVCYSVFNDAGEIVLSPVVSSQTKRKRIVLGAWK